MRQTATWKDVELLAQHVHVGSPAGTQCPECQAAGKGYVYRRAEDGTVWFKCWRNACGARRRISGDPAVGEAPPPPDRSYHGMIEKVPSDAYWWLLKRFPGLRVEDFDRRIRWNPERNTLLMRVNGADGVKHGWVERWASESWNAPPTGLFQPPEGDAPKVKTWHNDPVKKDHLAWYKDPHVVRDQALLVEDQISAMCLAGHARYNIVALLGTGINAPKIAELQRAGIKKLYIALDADATGQAFAHAKKWGMAFDYCKVIVLEKDIKDYSIDELKDFRL